MARWLAYAVLIALFAVLLALPSLFPENWITYGILVALLGVVFFLYLLARRAFVDFKKGVEEGR